MKYYTNVVRKGNKLLVRELDNNGQQLYTEVKYTPELFIQSRPEKSTHTSFYGGPLARMQFDSMYDMSQYVKEYSEMGEYLWGNTKFDIQYIYNTYGPTIEYNPKHIRAAYIDIECMTRQKINGVFIDGGFPNPETAEYPINAICQYDNVDDTFYLFGLNYDWTKDKSEFSDIAARTVYYNAETEEELLIMWLKHWSDTYPEIITGWNIEKFDIPYLYNRIGHILTERHQKQLSPWGLIDERVTHTKFGDETIYNIAGVSTLDYLDLYKKFTYKARESYKLDHIARCELQHEHKKEFTGTHGSFYWDDPQGFYDYNLKDVDIVLKLDYKLQLLDLAKSLAYYAGINYSDVYSPIKTWDSIIYRYCMSNDVVIPLGDKVQAREEYPGAWVFETVQGFQKSIASFDFTSLYPSVNRTWNIGADSILGQKQRLDVISDIIQICKDNSNDEYDSFLNELVHETPYIEHYLKYKRLPEKITEYLKNNQLSISPNWQFYDISKESVFTKLQTDLFIGRKTDKKKAQEYAQKAKEVKDTDKKLYEEYSHQKVVYDTSQLVKKILLNSLYGASGSPYFRFFNVKNAAATTLGGQLLIRLTAGAISDYICQVCKTNEKKDLVVAGDTDSCYINTQLILDTYAKPGMTINQKTDLLDKACVAIEKNCITPLLEQVTTSVNALQNVLGMDREVICVGAENTGICGFWTGKKHYALLVNDSEGYRYPDTGHLKIMGLSLVQSSTPEYFRDKLKSVTRMLITEGPQRVREYIKEVKTEYDTLPVEAIAFPRSVTNVAKYQTGNTFIKGTPVQSKAAIAHNVFVDQLKLKAEQPIRDGEKIKFLYLVSNPKHIDVIGFRDKLPKEFDIEHYVDRETHFQKAFIKPIEDIFIACGESLEEKVDMDEFF